MRHPCLLALALLACGKDDSAEGFGSLTGTLAIDDGESVAIDAQAAFGFEAGGKAVLYYAANPDATCADLAAVLTEGNQVDPTPLFLGGACNLFGYVQSWDGSEATWTSDPVAVTWALNCTIGDGAFAWEERGDDDGYYWSGRYWQGAPQQWTLTLSGGGGEAIEADIEMNDYDGDYIYEFTEATATGLVSGAVRASWCPDLAETPFL